MGNKAEFFAAVIELVAALVIFDEALVASSAADAIEAHDYHPC
jgi:hypothetical protein